VAYNHIGLSIIAKELGFKMLVIMPNDQAKEKEQYLQSLGAGMFI
jgi:cysteine synthase